MSPIVDTNFFDEQNYRQSFPTSSISNIQPPQQNEKHSPHYPLGKRNKYLSYLYLTIEIRRK